jgi:hypothetical protein
LHAASRFEPTTYLPLEATVSDRSTPGDADNPVTEAARDTDPSPAADASALRKLGSEAGDTERMNISGHGRQGTTEPGGLGAAAQDSYWRERFIEREYVDPERDYEYYRSAYRYGWESSDRHRDRSFDEVESDLKAGWDPDRAGLEWDEARPAVRDAFEKRSAVEWSDPGNPLA